MRDLDSIRATAAHPLCPPFGLDQLPTPFAKAASLAQSIIQRSPFVDGNKSTVVYAAAYLLETLGHELETEQKELEVFAVAVAKRTIEPEGNALWFEKYPCGT